MSTYQHPRNIYLHCQRQFPEPTSQSQEQQPARKTPGALSTSQVTKPIFMELKDSHSRAVWKTPAPQTRIQQSLWTGTRTFTSSQKLTNWTSVKKLGSRSLGGLPHPSWPSHHSSASLDDRLKKIEPKVGTILPADSINSEEMAFHATDVIGCSRKWVAKFTCASEFHEISYICL